jgi:alanine racemase
VNASMILLQNDAPDHAQYGCCMQINCDAIRANLAVLRHLASSRIMAVLKNDGYGLSLLGYARLLSQLGVTTFAVGTFEEALKLREDGIEGDVLLLTPQMALPVLRSMINNNIMLTVGSRAQAEAVLLAAQETKMPPLVHIMIDTGLGRYGFSTAEACEAAGILGSMHIMGTYTHFSAPYQNPWVTTQQYNAFLHAVDALRSRGIDTGILHCCASGAALSFPHMHLDMVRFGSALLGRVPQAGEFALQQAVALVAPINAIHETSSRSRLGYNGSIKLKKASKVGIVGAGTAYGYQQVRHCMGLLPSRQYADVGGQKAEVLGSLGINSLAINLTGIDCHETDRIKLAINPLHCAADLPRQFVRGGEVIAYVYN